MFTLRVHVVCVWSLEASPLQGRSVGRTGGARGDGPHVRPVVEAHAGDPRRRPAAHAAQVAGAPVSRCALWDFLQRAWRACYRPRPATGSNRTPALRSGGQSTISPAAQRIEQLQPSRASARTSPQPAQPREGAVLSTLYSKPAQVTWNGWCHDIRQAFASEGSGCGGGPRGALDALVGSTSWRHLSPARRPRPLRHTPPTPPYSTVHALLSSPDPRLSSSG